jgi:uncharacterized protein YjbI with pentapeptide repeats
MPDNRCRWTPSIPGRYYRCNEPSLPDDPDSCCILHSKNEDKDLNVFSKKIRDRMEKDPNRIDLGGCYFPKNFPSDFFVNQKFDKPVSFVEAIFSQNVHFMAAIFSQEVHFSGAAFAEEANFHWATFSQEANFLWTTFSQADFSKAKFSEVDFSGSTFKEGVNFSRAEFKDRAYFLPVSKKAKEEVKKVVFGGPSSFQCTRFIGEVIFQDVDLSQCSFLHSNIDKVDFKYCTFAKKGRRQNVLRDELDCREKVKDAKSRKEKKKAREGYEPVRRVYLELKRNFEEKKDWNTAGDFHFGEMECRRKQKGWWGRKLSLTAFYCWTSGYCERPLRTFIWLSVFVFGLFPLLYMLFEGFSANVWKDSVAVATIMRLGNPINDASGLGKFIVTVCELILSPILITLLALALRRKVKR